MRAFAGTSAILLLGCSDVELDNIGGFCGERTVQKIDFEDLGSAQRRRARDAAAADGTASATVRWSDDLEETVEVTTEVSLTTAFEVTFDPVSDLFGGFDQCDPVRAIRIDWSVSTDSGRLAGEGFLGRGVPSASDHLSLEHQWRPHHLRSVATTKLSSRIQ